PARRARPVARAHPPAQLADVRECERIPDRVLLLDERRAAAVLEVVAVAAAHVGVADAAEIDPDVRELMDEERSGVEVADAVDLLPFVGAAPRVVAARRDGVRRRSERENVEQERFVVALPAIRQEARVALRSPAVAERLAVLEQPIPLDPLVELFRESANLRLFGSIAVEVLRRGERAGDEDRRVDARQLAAPGALAALHVQEVVVEAAIAGGGLALALLARGEEPQGEQRALDSGRARHELSFHSDRIRGERHADGGDAARPVVRRFVEDQAVARIDLVDEVIERVLLEVAQKLVVVARRGHVASPASRRRASLTTWSTVNPYSRRSTCAGADAPKRSTPTIRPRSPT